MWIVPRPPVWKTNNATHRIYAKCSHVRTHCAYCVFGPILKISLNIMFIKRSVNSTNKWFCLYFVWNFNSRCEVAYTKLTEECLRMCEIYKYMVFSLIRYILDGSRLNIPLWLFYHGMCQSTVAMASIKNSNSIFAEDQMPPLLKNLCCLTRFHLFHN